MDFDLSSVVTYYPALLFELRRTGVWDDGCASLVSPAAKKDNEWGLEQDNEI